MVDLNLWELRTAPAAAQLNDLRVRHRARRADGGAVLLMRAASNAATCTDSLQLPASNAQAVAS